jgi:hypothetical protein
VEGLIKAASEFVAAVLGLVGYVGRGHRRSGIREDLGLLRELETFPDYFGRDTWPHTVLATRISLDVARLSGVDLPSERRKIPWSSIVLAALVGAPLGYLTFTLNEDGFRWYSLFPGAVAALMGISILGMLLPEQKAPDAAGIDQLQIDLDQTDYIEEIGPSGTD